MSVIVTLHHRGQAVVDLLRARNPPPPPVPPGPRGLDVAEVPVEPPLRGRQWSVAITYVFCTILHYLEG